MPETLMPQIVFYVFSALAVALSLMVILLKNPISSALSLVASFFCVSAVFILMHASFLGIMQVLIYAGAILVLFLYVLMLLNLQDGNWIFSYAWGWKTVVRTLSVACFMVFLVAFVLEIPATDWADVSKEFGTAESVGEMLLGQHVLAFEWISVLLFIAILGVIAVSAREKEKSGS